MSSVGDKPQPYNFLRRLSDVHLGQVIVGIARPYRNLFSYQASQSGNASISSSRFGADDAAIILSGQERTDEFDDSHHNI